MRPSSSCAGKMSLEGRCASGPGRQAACATALAAARPAARIRGGAARRSVHSRHGGRGASHGERSRLQLLGRSGPPAPRMTLEHLKYTMKIHEVQKATYRTLRKYPKFQVFPGKKDMRASSSCAGKMSLEGRCASGPGRQAACATALAAARPAARIRGGAARRSVHSRHGGRGASHGERSRLQLLGRSGPPA